jgi:hypothetical protein
MMGAQRATSRYKANEQSQKQEQLTLQEVSCKPAASGG